MSYYFDRVFHGLTAANLYNDNEETVYTVKRSAFNWTFAAIYDANNKCIGDGTGKF